MKRYMWLAPVLLAGGLIVALFASGANAGATPIGSDYESAACAAAARRVPLIIVVNRQPGNGTCPPLLDRVSSLGDVQQAVGEGRFMVVCLEGESIPAEVNSQVPAAAGAQYLAVFRQGALSQILPGPPEVALRRLLTGRLELTAPVPEGCVE